MTRRRTTGAFLLAGSLLFSAPIRAATDSWASYFEAFEAHAMKIAHPNEVLFVDVRDPVEIMFTGFSDVVDGNAPCQLADPTRFNAAGGQTTTAEVVRLAITDFRTPGDASLDLTPPTLRHRWDLTSPRVREQRRGHPCRHHSRVQRQRRQ